MELAFPLWHNDSLSHHLQKHTHRAQSLSVMQTHAYTNCQTQMHAIILFPPSSLSLTFSLKHTHTHLHTVRKKSTMRCCCVLLCWQGDAWMGRQAVEWEKRQEEMPCSTLYWQLSLCFSLCPSICLSEVTVSRSLQQLSRNVFFSWKNIHNLTGVELLVWSMSFLNENSLRHCCFQYEVKGTVRIKVMWFCLTSKCVALQV